MPHWLTLACVAAAGVRAVVAFAMVRDERATDCSTDGVDGPSYGIWCARVMVVAIAHRGAVR
jgi:hypothetical protein